MLIFIILIVTILCMIFFMVKISDRGDAVACKDLEPLSSPEQSSVSKHRPEQNSTPASKLDQELSNILDATDQIINHSHIHRKNVIWAALRWYGTKLGQSSKRLIQCSF